MFATELGPSSAATQRRRRERPGTPLSPVWYALLAALAMLGLLLAFQQVVRQAVQHGELRRRANASFADATWRCNTLRERQRRETCLAQLASVPRDNASLQLLQVALAASAVTSAR